MKLAAFDLECAVEIPEGTKDFREFAPYGITCAALAIETDDGCEVRFWEGVPQIISGSCMIIMQELYHDYVDQGYTIVTWNGCQFDFFALAQEMGYNSGFIGMTTELVLEHHIDLMLQFTFTSGHFLGLDKALAGAKLGGKLHDVTLSSGKVIHDMHGSKAPRLWKEGEYDAVLEYLEQDVIQLLALAKWVQKYKRIRWESNNGYDREVLIPELLTVEQCFDIPEPDTSWMDNPPSRETMVDWILNPGILKRGME